MSQKIELEVSTVVEMVNELDESFIALTRIAQLHARQKRPMIEKCSCGADPCPTLSYIDAWLASQGARA